MVNMTESVLFKANSNEQTSGQSSALTLRRKYLLISMIFKNILVLVIF